MTMARLFLSLGALLAGLAVVTGAFAAHGLRGRVEERLLDVFQTGAQYHFYHALGLCLVGLAAGQFGANRLLGVSGWLMIVGIVLFSGSLYLLAITGVRWLGAITPLGGTAFIGAWFCLAVAAWRAL